MHNLNSKKIKSLAGTDKQYYEVETAKGLRIRERENYKGQLRIHIQKDAPMINSRERDDYFAIDVDPIALLAVLAKALYFANGKS